MRLHNLSGRITYISSNAKQEYLYEVYATEPDRAFWRELAKCNQEEFEKSGTNGKCIEARELMIALLESFINDDKVATVDKAGKVTAKGCGVASIAITAAETKTHRPAQKTIALTVKPKKAGKHLLSASAPMRKRARRKFKETGAKRKQRR